MPTFSDTDEEVEAKPVFGHQDELVGDAPKPVFGHQDELADDSEDEGPKLEPTGPKPSYLDRYIDANIRPVQGAVKAIANTVPGLYGAGADITGALGGRTDFDNLPPDQLREKMDAAQQDLDFARAVPRDQMDQAAVDRIRRAQLAVNQLQRAQNGPSQDTASSGLRSLSDMLRHSQKNLSADLAPLKGIVPVNPALDESWASRVPEEMGGAATLLGGGPVSMAARAVGQAGQSAYDQTLQQTGNEQLAQAAGAKAKNSTLASLPLYMLGGALANEIPVRALAGPLETGVVKGGTNTLANMLSSAGIRAAEGQNPLDILSSLHMDLGFGAHTGLEAAKGVRPPLRSPESEQAAPSTNPLSPQGSEPTPVRPGNVAEDRLATGPLQRTENAPVPESPKPAGENAAPNDVLNPQTVPEAPATIAAQMEQLANGQRPAVMIPGFGEVPKRPPGMRQVVTENGTYIFDPKQTDAQTIRQLDAAGRQNEILGLGPQSKQDVAATGEKPVAVTERTPEGTEVKAAVASEGQAPQTAQELEASKTPGNVISTEAPENVLAKRVESREVAPDERAAAEGSPTGNERGLPAGREATEGPGARPGELPAGGVPEGGRAGAGEPGLGRRLNEGGYVTLPSVDEVAGFGRRIYKAGMDFAAWSREMVAHLGDGVRSLLVKAWNAITGQNVQNPGRRIRPDETGAVGSFGAEPKRGGKTMAEMLADFERREKAGKIDVPEAVPKIAKAWMDPEGKIHNVEKGPSGFAVHEEQAGKILGKPAELSTMARTDELKQKGWLRLQGAAEHGPTEGALHIEKGEQPLTVAQSKKLSDYATTHGRDVIHDTGAGRNPTLYSAPPIPQHASILRRRFEGGSVINPFGGREKFENVGKPVSADEIKEVLAGRAAPTIKAPAAQSVFSKVRETIGGGIKELRDILSPASASKDALESSLVLREANAAAAERAERFFRQNKATNEQFDKLSPAESLQVIDSVERPTAENKIPSLEGWVQSYRDAFAKRIKEVRELDPDALKTLIENYFPHIWGDPDAAAKAEQQAKIGNKTLQGSRAFLKRRAIPSIAEGVELGLQPKTWNPGELLQMKMGEMDKFIMARKALKVLEMRGLVRTEESPGDVAINRQIGGVKGKQFFATPDVARIFNNYLSPGLQGSKPYQALRYAANLMNQAQLSWSAFHAGFVTLDTMASKLSHGIFQTFNSAPNLFGQGRYGEAFSTALKGVGNMAIAPLGPVNLVRYLNEGNKIIKGWRSPEYAQGQIPELLDAMKAGGAKFSMDPVYHNAAWKDFMSDVRGGKYGGALAKFFPAIMEKTMAPIMEGLVPRAKAGVLAEMARDVLATMPEGSTRQDLRREMAKRVDSVDNRLGQLIYDNLFWNKTFKDVAMLAQRSVGWNLGTVRELGGGIKDIKDAAWEKKNPITVRSSYLLGMPILVGMYGALYQYLHTGKGPDDLKDVYAPRTGKRSPDGSEERVMLPSYIKDMYHYGTNPVNTVLNKVNPLISAVDMAARRNADFYGVEIRDKKADALSQALQVGKFGAKQFLPFTYSASNRRVKAPGEIEPVIESMIGIQPAPAEIRKSEAQRMMSEQSSKFAPDVKTQAQFDQSNLKRSTEDALRKGYDLTDEQKAFLSSLSEKQRNALDKATGQDPRLNQFRRMPYAQRQQIYDAGTDEEKKLFAPYLTKPTSPKQRTQATPAR